MTREELESRYRLVEQVTDGDVRTHHAVAAAGTVVMVHFIRPGTPTGDRALARLDALEGAEAERVLRVHEVDGERVIVTRFLMDEGSLADWLKLEEGRSAQEHPEPEPRGEELPGEKPAAPGEEGAPGAAGGAGAAGGDDRTDAAGGGGEFTRLFRAIRPGPGEEGGPPAPPPGEASSAEEAGSGPPDAEPAPGAPTPEEPASGQGPGEFTRLFRAMDAPDPSPEAGAEPPRTPDDPPRTASPESPDPSPSPARGTEASPEQGAEPGEFTRQFGRIERPGTGPEPAREPPSSERRDKDGLSYRPPGGPSPQRGRGPGGGPSETRPSSGPDADDYFDRLRHGPAPSPPASGAPSPPPGAPSSGPGSPPPPPVTPSSGSGSVPPPPPPPSPGRSGPSEFTRVIQAGGGGQLPGTGPVPPAPPRAPSAPGPAAPKLPSPPSGGGGGGGPVSLLLIGGMALVFLLALALVLFFALAGGNEEEPAEVPEDPPAAETAWGPGTERDGPTTA